MHTSSVARQEASLQTMRASTNIQPCKLVPEFKEVVQHPADQPLPPHPRKLSTPSLGYITSAQQSDARLPEAADLVSKEKNITVYAFTIHRMSL